MRGPIQIGLAAFARLSAQSVDSSHICLRLVALCGFPFCWKAGLMVRWGFFVKSVMIAWQKFVSAASPQEGSKFFDRLRTCCSTGDALPWWSVPGARADVCTGYLRGAAALPVGVVIIWIGCAITCRQTPGLFRVVRWRRQIKADPHPFFGIAGVSAPSRATPSDRAHLRGGGEAARPPRRIVTRQAHPCSQGKEEVVS
jgi:hypothetical protein